MPKKENFYSVNKNYSFQEIVNGFEKMNKNLTYEEKEQAYTFLFEKFDNLLKNKKILESCLGVFISKIKFSLKNKQIYKIRDSYVFSIDFALYEYFLNCFYFNSYEVKLNFSYIIFNLSFFKDFLEKGINFNADNNLKIKINNHKLHIIDLLQNKDIFFDISSHYYSNKIKIFMSKDTDYFIFNKSLYKSLLISKKSFSKKNFIFLSSIFSFALLNKKDNIYISFLFD